MITILAHGGLYDQARAHVTYAKCLSANAPSFEMEENKLSKKEVEESKKVMILEGIKHLHKGKKLFERLKTNDRLKSTLYLLSVFYNEIDMFEERNKYAFEFRQLDQQFPTEVNHVFLF